MDVVIVTAVKGDDEAVRAVDQGGQGDWESIPRFAGRDWTVWTRTYASVRDEPLRVVLAPLPAAGIDALADLLDFCHPQCLASCGAGTGRPGSMELGDVIIADLVYRCELAEGEAAGARVYRPEPTDYQIPTAWKYAANQLEVAADSWWAKNQARSEEEQRQWLLGELGAGRDPLAAPDWEQHCPHWDKVLESLWASGLLEPDSVELSAKGVQAAKRLASLPPKEVVPTSVPHVHVAALAAGSSLRKSDRIWDELGDRQRLVCGIDWDGSLVGFVGLSPELMHVVVRGVADLGEPGRKQRSRTFATRAAAEVLLELLRNVLIPAGPMAEDVLSSNRSPLVAHDNPGALLAARYALVPFHELGRQLELGELEAWCSSDRALAVRLFAGPEGSGKTRLLMEWTKRLRARGWAAGFLDGEITPSEIGTLLGESRPVLIVVDDAASRPGLVGVLAALASGPEGPPKLRVILLERDRGDWWESLKKRDRALGDLLGQDEPGYLVPVVEGPEREAIFRAAADAFSQRLGRPTPDHPTVDLGNPSFDRILYLHMAALADVLELGLTSEQLLGGIVAYEVRTWGSICKVPGTEAEESQRSAARYAAAVSLLGGMATLEQAEALRERVKGPRHARFVEGFASIYPGVSPERAAIAPVEPDLLCEALVSDVVTRESDPAQYLESVFAGANDAALEHGLVMLGRVAAHCQRMGKSDEPLRDWARATLRADLETRALPALRAAIALGTEDRAGLIGSVLGELLEGTNLLAVAPLVEQVVPEQSVSLRQVGVWALRSLLAQPLEKEARARVLRELGSRLSELGQRDAALGVVQEAVELYRQLVTTDPDQFAPDLARSLHQLGVRLSEVGQWQPAVEAAQEGTELYRDLEADQPEAFRPHLAAGLGDLGRLLSGTGQREAALGATEEAADLYRQLTEARPDTYASCLATSLSDLGLRLNELGQKERAVRATEESIRIRRDLAAVWPDMFLPELATSLNNLGKMLTDLGQREAAVKVTEEAIGIRRELARSFPATYVPALAVSLNNLGANLRRLGQQEAAFAALSEAVTLYEGLAERQPAAFEPKLAIARKNLRNLLEKTGLSSAPPPPPSEPPDPSST